MIIRCGQCQSNLGEYKDGFTPKQERMQIKRIENGVVKIKCRRCSGVTVWKMQQGSSGFCFSDKETAKNLLY